MPILASKHDLALVIPWLPPTSPLLQLYQSHQQWLLASTTTSSATIDAQGLLLLDGVGGCGGGKPCLLCQNRRTLFYCQDCVRRGEFCHSNPRKLEALTEKRLRAMEIERGTRANAEKIVERCRRGPQESKRLAEKIKSCRQRIKYLNFLIRDKKEKVVKVNEYGQKLLVMNQKRTERLPSFQHKVEQISRACTHYQQDLHSNRSRFNEEEKDLAVLRRRYLTELTTYVFPVTEVFPEEGDGESQQGEEEEELMVAYSLSDAIQTSFINGRWVTTNEASGEMQYKIVEATLSGVGDYGAYHAWKAQQQLHELHGGGSVGLGLGLGPTDEQQPNPAFTICAGLMFTAQLVQHLASVLDVVLPKRIRYHDFGGASASEYRFSRRVAMLNIDVLYLCLSQGVAAERLRPRAALHDVKLLLDLVYESSSHVGRSFQCFREAQRLHDMSLVLLEELDKVQITSEDLQEAEEDEGDGYVGFRFEGEGDWDSLNDVLTSVQWPQHLLQSQKQQYSSLGHEETAAATGAHDGGGAVSHAALMQLQSPSSYSASSFVSSLWRGFAS